MESDLRIQRNFNLNRSGAVPMRDLAKFVKTANRFASSVIVRSGSGGADGKSALAMSSLNLAGGRDFTVKAWGWDAPECIEALSRCIGEWESAPLLAMAA